MLSEMGAVTLIAHPTLWGYSDELIHEHLEYARSIGVNGVEVFHADTDTEHTKSLCRFWDDHFISCGGDFHYEGTGRLGNPKGNFEMTDAERVQLIKGIFGSLVV